MVNLLWCLGRMAVFINHKVMEKATKSTVNEGKWMESYKKERAQ